jgi:TatD DNase family protein
MTAFYDAHNHLQDQRLNPWREAIVAELPAAGLRGAIVNGTREADWPAVRRLCREHAWLRPAYGLHPWHVAERTPDWLECLATELRNDPLASLGEVGLDRWVEGHDLALQREVLSQQWKVAADEHRVATVHCLRAWGPLMDFLAAAPPLRAFLLHSYGGSAEFAAELVKQGAYFSFSPYFLHERKARQREVFAELPLDRILIETDAPDMAPPPERNAHPLTDGSGTLNHPLNLLPAYRAMAELRGMPLEEFASQIEANFLRFIGS